MLSKSLLNVTLSVSSHPVKVVELLDESPYRTFLRGKDAHSHEVLIKALDLSTNPDLATRYENEVLGLSQIGQHANITSLSMHQKYSSPRACAVMVFEGGMKASLSALRRRQELEERQVATILRGVASGLAHIHGKNFAHREIRMETIFFDAALNPKIQEFGSCTGRVASTERVWMTPSHLLSPEQVNPGQPLSQAVDMWSLGCVAYQLLFGEPPFSPDRQQDQLSGHYKPPNKAVSDSWFPLLEGLFTVEPRMRLTARKAIEELDALMKNLADRQNQPAAIEAKSGSKLSTMFMTSTSSWIKGATQASDGPLVTVFVQKLLQKAWNKPEKIPKFYDSIAKRPFEITSICIKCLLLLHQYLLEGPEAVALNNQPQSILAIAERSWAPSAKVRGDECRTEYIAGLVRLYLKLLRAKLQLHAEARTQVNWEGAAPKTMDELQKTLALWHDAVDLGGKTVAKGPLQRLRTVWLEQLALEMAGIMNAVFLSLPAIAGNPANRASIAAALMTVQMCYWKQRKLLSLLHSQLDVSRAALLPEDLPYEITRIVDCIPGAKWVAEREDEVEDSPRRDRAVTQPFEYCPPLGATPSRHDVATDEDRSAAMRQRAVTEEDEEKEDPPDTAQHLQSNRVPTPDAEEEEYHTPKERLIEEVKKPQQVDGLLHGEHQWLINFSELQFKEVVGMGASCTVYKGLYKRTQVAIKVMKGYQQGTSLKEFTREVSAMMRLRHPNLVLFMGACTDKQLVIVSEFCAGETLFKLLHERRDVTLTQKQQFKMMKDIAQGMLYLHSLTPPIIHRDLKTLNLLLAEPVTGPSDSILLKLTDFGVSKNFLDADAGMMTGQMGTCHWMAPEVLANKPYGLPADVYSFGIVLWEILTRQTPYRGMNTAQICNAVVNLNERPNQTLIPPDVPGSIRALMMKCWHTNPTSRPTFEQILDILDNV